MDRHDDDGKVQYVRGVNWAPDSYDEDEGEDEVLSESEVQFVQDTYAGETEVPDSQMEIADVDEPDTVHALESFASKFESDKVKHEGCSLLLILIIPDHGIIEFIGRAIPLPYLVPIYWIFKG
jgi:hypothetical protein